MKTKIIMFVILGICTAGICFAQSNPDSTGVTTKMNGSSTTASGVAISSSSIGSVGRNTPNNGV
jgi:hypothetical protein